MDKKTKAIKIIYIINTALMAIATILIYANLNKPYLVYSTSTSSILDFYKSNSFWFILPALSCAILIYSSKFKFLCIFSFFVSLFFLLFVYFGVSVAAAINALESLAHYYDKDAAPTLGYGYARLEQLSIISMALCVVHLSLDLIRLALHINYGPQKPSKQITQIPIPNQL